MKNIKIMIKKILETIWKLIIIICFVLFTLYIGNTNIEVDTDIQKLSIDIRSPLILGIWLIGVLFIMLIDYIIEVWKKEK